MNVVNIVNVAHEAETSCHSGQSVAFSRSELVLAGKRKLRAHTFVVSGDRRRQKTSPSRTRGTLASGDLFPNSGRAGQPGRSWRHATWAHCSESEFISGRFIPTGTYLESTFSELAITSPHSLTPVDVFENTGGCYFTYNRRR